MSSFLSAKRLSLLALAPLALAASPLHAEILVDEVPVTSELSSADSGSGCAGANTVYLSLSTTEAPQTDPSLSQSPDIATDGKTVG